MKRLLPLIGAAATITLAGCIPSSEQAPPPPAAPVPVPTPAPASPPPPALGADWRDWPLTPGNWSYRRESSGSTASFGRAGFEPELTLRCEGAARVIAMSVRGAGTALTVRTTSLIRALTLEPAGTVRLAARDGLLDAMGFSRGRFVIERTGTPALVVPAYAEVLRVTEDCRG